MIITKKSVPMRNAMNEITRQAYVDDCRIGLMRWNKMIRRAGYDIELTLPSTRFRRNIGIWSDVTTNPKGGLISKEEFLNHKNDWIPSESDKKFINSIMIQVTDPSKTADWISPPNRGINNQKINYSYVDLK